MRYSIFLILLASMSLNAGTIHKWVDDEGNVHYGDSPPASVKTEGVRVQAAPSNPGKALPRLSTPGSAEPTDTAANGSPTDESQVPEDQAQLACDNAQKDLKTIASSNRIKLRMSDGSTRYMTTEEIEERKAQAQADVERFCQ